MGGGGKSLIISVLLIIIACIPSLSARDVSYSDVESAAVDTVPATGRVSYRPHADGYYLGDRIPAHRIHRSWNTWYHAHSDYDTWAIKSNALYLAAGVTNLGAELSLDHNWSIDFPVVYSPYTIARSYRMRFMYFQPEARYWFDRPMRGHFFGFHAHAGVFNVSVDDRNRYQSPHGFYGAGLSYGYSLPLARRWSAEFTVGLGYAHTKYDTYYNVHNGIRYRKDTPYNYWGVTKLGVNIVYRFGDKSWKKKEATQ